MNREPEQIFDYIDGHRDAMVSLWSNLVKIESPSSEKERVAKIASHLDTYTDSLGMERRLFTFELAGPTFTAQTAKGTLAPIALIGHMDTVHPVGSFGDETFRIEGDRVTGPGVFDMKGGLVVALKIA